MADLNNEKAADGLLFLAGRRMNVHIGKRTIMWALVVQLRERGLVVTRNRGEGLSRIVPTKKGRAYLKEMGQEYFTKGKRANA